MAAILLAKFIQKILPKSSKLGSFFQNYYCKEIVPRNETIAGVRQPAPPTPQQVQAIDALQLLAEVYTGTANLPTVHYVVDGAEVPFSCLSVFGVFSFFSQTINTIFSVKFILNK